MSLDRQIFIYSFDTSAFYTDEEHAVEQKINEASARKSKLKSEQDILNQFYNGAITQAKAETRYRALYKIKREDPVELGDLARIDIIKREIKAANRTITVLKVELVRLLGAHHSERALREEYVVDKNIISVFDSTLTRTLGMKENNLYDDIMVIRTYYFQVVEDMILHGYTYNGERYICFTASAGQIRTKKTVFIKEKVWEKYHKTLMCGLSVESINAQGGININKYLAYLALCNSATDPWTGFDIHKSIVVDDMETMVTGVVDYIDRDTYEIERKEMQIPITHTDGCGMMLPSVSKDNMMVRLPWVKGLLAVFPFDKFIKEADARNPTVSHSIVRDIYGKEHDVLAEGIEVIFTKSQFKMYKYYPSWDAYIEAYESNGCTAGKCNQEEDFLPDAKLNYQMLQTLTDITDEELIELSSKSVDKISRVAADRDTMLNVFGASPQFYNKNAFQECLQLYPELLSDPYTKETLKLVKKNLVKEAKSAKLDLSAKYMFLVPDLYAFCEWLFLGYTDPVGLLNDGEVSCYLYRNVDKLDCLRSPHLYREHAVRKNVVNPATRKWFSQKAIYTSCHDLISKILMFDNDGDKSLVCADPLLVKIAERNMVGIVPLYYEMAKAGAVQITNQAIYDGLRAAWTGGNIGVISNDITKIWNSENVDLDAIKMFCMENNFTIDYAKTLYKPTHPDDIDARLSQFTRTKVPHFFVYAKNKTPRQVQKTNASNINKLDAIIPNKKMSFSAKNIGLFKYRYMLSDPDRDMEPLPEVIELYNKVEKQYRYSVNFYDDVTNCGYLSETIWREFCELGYDMNDICDTLIKYLFKDKQSKRKGVFWMVFGEIVLDNLRRNIPKGSIQCRKCGERFVPTASQQKLCDKCAAYQKKPFKEIVCVDCGKTFVVAGNVKNKKRCDECQAQKVRAYEREKKKAQREKAKCPYV